MDPFGLTDSRSTSVPNRLLTNDITAPGCALIGADILLNETKIVAALQGAELLFGCPFRREDGLAALQRLLMHEIGHAPGFHHLSLPEWGPVNFDTDLDPLNAMRIDPFHPFDRLLQSPHVDHNAIMSVILIELPEALLFTELREDHRGGRDARYLAWPAARTCGPGAGDPDTAYDDGAPPDRPPEPKCKDEPVGRAYSWLLLSVRKPRESTRLPLRQRS